MAKFSTPAIWSHSLVLVVAVLLTSAIWLTAFFAGVQPAYNNNNNNNNNVPEDETCEMSDAPKCGDTCEFVICESIPVGLQFDSKYPNFNSTTDCWMRLMDVAQEEIIMGSYYWSLLAKDTEPDYTVDTTNTSGDGEKIYNKILETATKKGVSIRIAQNYDEDGSAETQNLTNLSNGKISVRSLKFTNWYPGGILHTKSWSVDGKHLYIGSTNFDWRSMTQVKELGLAVFNCPCVGEDLKNLLEIYWRMGAPGATIPQKWDDNLAASANHEKPLSVYSTTQKETEAIYISASPPGFQSCGREDDLTAMIKNIDEAQEYLNLAVMDYSPSTLYMKNANKWKPELDNAMRRAAFERGVKVRFMVSLWPHTYKDVYGILYSLQDISQNLPCHAYDKNNTCTKKGSIEVRFVEVPSLQYGAVPYARVYHNKYFVTESAAYIGTSNWSSDYWQYTAGIGIIVRANDSTSKSKLVNDITQVFERDWNSNYTIPLSQFTISGNRTSSNF
ncbi:unnamed protein product [Caenorhabditis angaria]|uniref:PLD phosphodiesterase domain-containing protein n=1 Tax=Caenorhabditis angaria TaxID=860376 RepID=A0A9P1N7E4_9PELO|nr:unnamed protein product [Caenorhabditis angaria]